MSPTRASCLSLLCQEPNGGYPNDIVVGGKFCIDCLQMEVDGKGDSTGHFRNKRPDGIVRPPGNWLAEFVDVAHDFDRHVLRSDCDDRSGEDMLAEQLSTLYVQHGIEVAGDDVSGAWLDPALVREGRAVEMSFV